MKRDKAITVTGFIAGMLILVFFLHVSYNADIEKKAPNVLLPLNVK